MNFLRYLFLFNFCVINIFGAVTGFDVVAINKIEKEIHSFLQKKPVGWQQQIKMRIDQLEKQYVPKGYDKEKIIFFKKMIEEQRSEPRPENSAWRPSVETIQEYAKEKEVIPQLQLLNKSSENIEKELHELLLVPIEDRTNDWKAVVNKHIFALSTREPEKAQDYFEKIYVPKHEPSKSFVIEKETLPVQQREELLPEIKTEDIEKELAELLLIPQEDRPDDWKAVVNKNIFALATREPEKAQEYLEEVYTPKVEPIVLQAPINVPSEQISEQVPVAPVEISEPHRPTSAPKEQFAAELLSQGPVTGAQEIVEVVPQILVEQMPSQQISEQEQVTPVEISVPQKPTSAPKEQFAAELLSQGPVTGAQEIVEVVPVEQAPVEEVPVKVAPQEQPVTVQEAVNKEKKIEEISKNIDQLLTLPQNRKTSAWEKEMEELIFELSLYDKEKARGYLKKMYVQVSPAQPAQVTPITQTAPQQGTPPQGPPPPPMTGGPKLGGPPPPLPGGKPIAPKAPVITLGSLRKMKNSELLGLLDKYLIELDKSWNEQSNEVVKVKTAYGEKTEMIRGVPELAWSNILNTIKKVIIEKNIMTESEVTATINDRIKAVRAEKVQKAAQVVVKEEKAIEEDPKKGLQDQLSVLFSNPQTTQMPWLVGVKSAIKKLDAFDHEAALKYQEEYIQLLPKERRFIKP